MQKFGAEIYPLPNCLIINVLHSNSIGFLFEAAKVQKKNDIKAKNAKKNQYVPTNKKLRIETVLLHVAERPLRHKMPHIAAFLDALADEGGRNLQNRGFQDGY